MQTIIIDVGVYTSFGVDLTDDSINLANGDKFILAIKNSVNDSGFGIITREFIGKKIHEVLITPEESRMINKGAVYDIVQINAYDECFKIIENGGINLYRGVYQCNS